MQTTRQATPATLGARADAVKPVSSKRDSRVPYALREMAVRLDEVCDLTVGLPRSYEAA